MKKCICAGVIVTVMNIQSATAELLASDTFSSGNVAGDYVNGKSLSDALNAAVVADTTGYGTNVWDMGSSFMTVRNNINPFQNLNHPGALDGATGVVFAVCGAAGEDRVSNRILDATTSTSNTYYFSGLVNRKAVSSLDVGESITMGLQKWRHVHTNDFSTGIHLGVYRFGAGDNDYKISVFAGDARYDLEDAGYQRTYQVVVRVDVDASGPEKLWAWSGWSEQPNLTRRLDAESIETWSSSDDFEAFIIQTKGLLAKDNVGGVLLDEMRFGTTMADVTTLGETLLAGQIALESFSTANSTEDYSHNVSFSDTANRDVLAGNAGFVGEAWETSTTLILPRSLDGLSHTGLIGSAVNGYALANPAGEGVDRNIKRSFTSVPTSGTYYISGLFKSTGLGNFEDGCAMTMGVGDDVAPAVSFSSAVSRGVHLGLYRESGIAYLGAFAGSNTYQLAEVNFNTTYQIIAELKVDEGGHETLSAWYAADGDVTATEVLTDFSVETYGSPADLSYLVLNVKGGGSGASSGILMDELRFGTQPGAVTTYMIADAPTEMGEIFIAIDGDNAVISWGGTNLLTYALQGRDVLEGGGWSNLVSGIEGVDGSMSATNSTLANEALFYRVIAN